VPEAVAAVLFDCDGVLIESWDSTMRYFNRVREELGMGPMGAADEEYAFAHTVEESLRRMVPQELLPRLAAARERVSFREILPLVRPQEGIEDFLADLRASGRRMGVVTNGGAEQFMILEHVGLLRFFERMVTADDVAEGKPSPEGVLLLLERFGASPDRALFLGDSDLDMLTAERAGVPFWAYRNPRLRAERHVASFHELLA
jgi:HAD superfamily hydrolase (TIGR01509 family)